MASELERTRTDLVVHVNGAYPPGTRMLQGSRADLEEHIRTEGARAVGRFRPLPGGGTAIPVVYVAKRTVGQSWPERHRVALLATGIPLVVLSGLALLVAWVGWAWFLGGLVAAAALVATLVRWSRGGGGGRTGNITVNVNANTGRR